MSGQSAKKTLCDVHRLRHLVLETEGTDEIPSDVLFYLLQEIKAHLAIDLPRTWDTRKKADRAKWWLEYLHAVLLCANGESLLEEAFAPSFVSAETNDLLVLNDESNEGEHNWNCCQLLMSYFVKGTKPNSTTMSVYSKMETLLQHSGFPETS